MGTLTIFDSLYNRERVVVQLITAVGVWLLFGCFFEWCGGLGLGDVKYAGVIGYMLGPELVIAGLLSGTVLALGFWTAGKLAGRWGRGKRIAFGPWLSLGAIVVQVLSGWGCMA
jgi:prepilin signal peptidase PulO-like enzyme (type II secretory pathway)